MEFLEQWSEAAWTSVGWFWMALWAFVFGYLVSACIQVFMSQDRMQSLMGGDGVRSVSLATGFGFISSSCSFAAIATARALFRKGAGFASSQAFLLASTNLVIELGVVIAVFLAWPFVLGEYVGGVLLILVSVALLLLVVPDRWIDAARERDAEHHHHGDAGQGGWSALAEKGAWGRVGRAFHAEWGMVWRDVLVGFTVAGVVQAFVPTRFFSWLFPGTGQDDLAVWQVIVQALVAPLAAFVTFIGSMGNVPLAAVLYSSGVSFAGVLAFLFSDLIVLPALRIQARYYGWKLALTLVGVFYVAIVVVALVLHLGFGVVGWLPSPGAASSLDREMFALDSTFALNLAAVLVTGVLAWLSLSTPAAGGPHHHGRGGVIEKGMKVVAPLAALWLAGGLVVGCFVG